MLYRSVRDALKHIRYRTKYLFMNRGRFGPGAILPIIRRILPGVIATDLVGVQPMSGPASQIMTLKHRYGGAAPIEENLMGRWKREFNRLKDAVRTFSLYPFPPKQ